MAVRDLLKVTQARASRVSKGVARSASTDLYSGSGGAILMPRLDVNRRDTRPSTNLPNNPLMFGPVWKIATRMGALPIKVYRLRNDGVREDANDHPAYQLLRRPNPSLTRNLLVANLVVDLLIMGRGAWLKVRATPDSPPLELWPIPGQALRVKVDKKTLVGGFEVEIEGRRVPLRLEDVCYFRLLPDNAQLAEGISPFLPLTTIAGLGATAIDAGVDMFTHAMLGRLSARSPKGLSERAFRRLKRQLTDVMRDKFSIPLLEEGVELHDHQGPSDEVVLNAISVTSKLIRDTLGLPENDDPVMFTKHAIQPIADAIEQELERTLMPEFEEPGFPEFAFRDALRGDPLERAKLHQTRILSGQETPNEARRDENRPPIEGGDDALVPLNVIKLSEAIDPAADEPRAKDSGGGLGGDEGKGTLAAASAQHRAMRARRSKWSTLRDRIIKRNAEAMAQKIRAVVNKEAKAIKSAVNDGRSSRAEQSFPTESQLRKIIARSDAEMADTLERFMRQAGDASAPGAAELLDHELEDDALDALADVYASRASAVAERFAGVRGDKIIGLVQEAADKGTTTRELAGKISEAYRTLSTNYVDGIARTETAFAHEQAALITWSDAGVRQVEVVFGGGECTTGVCEDNAAASPFDLGAKMDNVGVSFEGADAPPFHPGCTCFAVPFIEED